MDYSAGTTNRTRATARFLTAAGIGSSLLLTAGLLLTVTVIGLVIATPALVIFSPVLVPAGIVALLVLAGLVVSGGFGVAALSALAWIYNYVVGKRPVGSGGLDTVRMKLAEMTTGATEKVKDYGHYVQSKTQKVTS